MIRGVKDEIVGISSGGLFVIRLFVQTVSHALPLDIVSGPQVERFRNGDVVANSLFTHQLDRKFHFFVQGQDADR